GFAMGDVTVERAAPPSAGFARWLADVRAQLTRQLQQGIGGRSGGIAAALVTGDRGGIDLEVTEAMRDSGLAHLIAISGLHFAVVVGGTLWLVRRLLTLWPWFALRYDARITAAAFAALAGVAYMLIAGASVPSVRACIAVLIVLIGLATGREAISLRLVAVGATAILIWRPDYLLSPSFQLSFAAVTGIVALYQSAWGRKWSAPDRKRGWPARAGRSIAALVMTGLVAEMTIGPIALFHFNQMGIYGVGANLIAIPLTSFVIIPLLLLAVLTEPLGLSGPVHDALGYAIEQLINLAEVTASLPGAVSTAPAMPVSAITLMVVGGLWICIWQTRRRWAGGGAVLAGVVIALTAPHPDIFVDPSGRHVAVVTDDGIAMLRPRVGDYITDMWSGAAGVRQNIQIEGSGNASCSRDSCRLDVIRNGRRWRIFATRSKDLIGRGEMEPVCRDADIVVSDRNLPDWCRPRWLLLNRSELQRLGAVSIDLDRAMLRSSAAEDGEHPWARGALR
ncbi:MAG: ComEC/Rec2 family competence protein, partial [Pacificimonas sp.]